VDQLDYAKANRQMVAERQALLAERDRLQQELSQRCVDDATAVIKGLGTLVELARNNNPGAKLALKTLLAHLEAAKLASSALLLAKD
jgi:hypothetical protein